MTVRINVRADISEARRLFFELGPGVDRAASRALNDTITTVRAEGARSIKAKHKALKIGDLKREMRLQKATRNSLTAAARTTGRPLPLDRFRPTWLKAGVKATIGTKRSLMGTAGRRVFRIPAYGNDYFIRRNPTGRSVRRFRGPSLPAVFRAKTEEFERIARRRWRVVFPNRLRFEIEKAQRKARGLG